MNNVVIATPVYRNAMTEMLTCRNQVMDTCVTTEIGVAEVTRMADISRARNSLINMAFSQKFVTHVYFWDSDVTTPHTGGEHGNLIDMMLAHDLPFVAGDCGANDEIGRVGGASMLIRRDVFDTMSTPELQYGVEQYALFLPMIHEGVYLSEDYAFCQRWFNAGGDIFVDTNIVTKHLDTL